LANTSGGPGNTSVIIAQRKEWQAVKSINID